MRSFPLVRALSLVAAFAAGGLAVTLIAGRTLTLSAQSSAGALPDQNTLEVLLAKHEILEQIYNYCRGLDRMDKALALQVWHADGTADFGGKVTLGSEFVERAFTLHEAYLAHTHQMVQSIVKVTGPTTAVSETTANTSMLQAIAERRVQGVLVTPPGASASLIRGRYADRWSRRDGRWALDHRRYIEDFRTVQEVPDVRPSQARRDRTDPSYAIYPY
ncbi:MAG: nuclear transport factor 2 family protein [Acidimicrobiia bacterium]|nr:nuclear transport factor 2 family protein [Acidimicrobiia bacterium]